MENRKAHFRACVYNHSKLHLQEALRLMPKISSVYKAFIIVGLFPWSKSHPVKSRLKIKNSIKIQETYHTLEIPTKI
jgi:hypothetical protein